LEQSYGTLVASQDCFVQAKYWVYTGEAEILSGSSYKIQKRLSSLQEKEKYQKRH